MLKPFMEKKVIVGLPYKMHGKIIRGGAFMAVVAIFGHLECWRTGANRGRMIA